MSEARKWSDTPLCVADGGQDLVAGYGELGQVGSWLPGKLAEGHTLQGPFDKKSH